MARATTKKELIENSEKNFEKLWKLIDSMSEEEQNENFIIEDRDKNIRDVLVHMYEWHLLILNWVDSNLKGETKPFLPEPYNWRTYPNMNIEIWEKHQKTPYKESRKMLKETHKKVMNLVERFSDEELFTKKLYNWTGTTSLGSYVISATSSHYDWAFKKIKKYHSAHSKKKK